MQQEDKPESDIVEATSEESVEVEPVDKAIKLPFTFAKVILTEFRGTNLI